MEPLLKKFSKVNYNNILEKVLEKKDFTANTKNLLLSMLYKIETAYNDYKLVKVLVKDKESFLQNIIDTIDKKCVVIKLVEPYSEIGKAMHKNNIEAFIENNVALVCYPTEIALLDGITLFMDNKFYINSIYRIVDIVIRDFLIKSYSLNIKECISNFDGWSWNNLFKNEDDLLFIIIYYNFLDLFGENIIEEWRLSKTSEDYVQIITKMMIKKYGEQNARRLLILFYRFFLKILVTKYTNENLDILEEAEKIKNAIDYMNNKPKFMQDIYDKKKIINDRIKEIEAMMLDKNTLRKKYEETNAKLPLDKQIFSIRRFLIMIKQERENLYNDIKNYNIKLDPKKFIQEKKELEEKYIKFLDVEKIKKSNVSLLTEVRRIQKKVLELKEFDLQNISNKKDILRELYILRYYKNLKFKNNVYIKTDKLLKKTLWSYERKLLSCACSNNLFIKLSQDNIQNLELLSLILDTKIINFKDIEILARLDNKKIVLDIYDGEIYDSTLFLGEEVKELNLKENKKIKLLI